MRLGLAVLSACVLAAAGLLTWLLVSWYAQVGRIEAAMGRLERDDLPTLAPTGDRDLDRIVTALNLAGTRVTEARRQSETMGRQMASAERLAAIGRMTAAFAHEIRNPIAAMRLKAENALASDDQRRRMALDTIIAQISRLDRLVEQLLTASHRKVPDASNTDMADFLNTVVAPHRETASARDIRLTVVSTTPTATFDREMMVLALQNLIGNALQHVPGGGEIAITAGQIDGGFRFTVSDTGPGVPIELRDKLFEPFVTGRADGTGLGLAIVRETVVSHGGTVRLEPGGPGATFVIDLPIPGVAC